MKQRTLITCLLISSFFGYISLFGSGLFIFQIELFILENLTNSFSLSLGSVIYCPFTSLSTFEFVPLTGQMLLGIALLLSIAKKAVACKVVSVVGIIFLLTPFGFILYSGIVDSNFKMIASTIPLFCFAGLLLWSFKKKKQ